MERRAASSLELFFDLVFVIAVSIAAATLHEHLVESGEGVIRALVSYLCVFFAVWWTWMNFTWFATSFDSDDWLYRVLTFVQMGCVRPVPGETPAVPPPASRRSTAARMATLSAPEVGPRTT